MGQVLVLLRTCSAKGAYMAAAHARVSPKHKNMLRAGSAWTRVYVRYPRLVWVGRRYKFMRPGWP